MTDPEKKIISTIQGISGKYSPYEVFTDWIRCSALAIQNACTIRGTKAWQDREKLYMDTISRYCEAEQTKFSEMFALLADALTEEMSDVLGDIYMQAGMGSKTTGQFFTPFHLSELCARLSLQKQIESFSGETIELNEPSCGGGGMIIAAAKVLKDAGINPQKHLKIVAQDLDWKGVYMCYLQLSLLGLKATVVQGNTLSDPYRKDYSAECTMKTPGWMGVLI